MDVWTALTTRVRGVLKSRIALAAFLGLSAVAILAEPFGTYGALELLPRIVYWTVIIGISIFAGAMVDEVSQRFTRPFSAWRSAILGSVLMTIVYAPIVYGWTLIFRAFGAMLGGEFWRITLAVFVPTLAVFSLIHLLRPLMQSQEHETPLDAAPEATPLVELRPRLANRLECPDATIFRVSANDHRTEVATNHGSQTIRMRFADAVTEMDPVPGCCVHRSHWVARDAVDGLVRQDGKLLVQLTNGDEVPVSRTYRPRLEDARPDLF